MSLVSIITPIYKAEKYLQKCLDSIIAQTYTNWEAILVDDGSPDNSGAICDEYATKDKRFKVIHQINRGVSVARQTGLNNANGDYIIHCDPDDWVEPNMLEELLLIAVEKNADMVVCDFIREENSKSNYCSQNLENPITAKEVQKRIINGNIHGSCCNKLIKKSCIAEIGFFPSSISFCEDELFNIRVLNNNIIVAYLPKAFYHYNIHSTSICHSPNPKVLLSKKTVIEECEKIVKKEDYCNLYAMKKSLLTFLFLNKSFNELKNTYKEIHQQIIEAHNKYNFFNPLGFFVAQALKKSPIISYRLYKTNMVLLNFIQGIRHRQ